MILCVGLSPTVQRILFFDDLRLGGVNRASQVIRATGGKALGVARTVTLLGGDACLVQVLGGDSGRFIARRLDEQGVRHETVWAEGNAPTRTCTTLISADGIVTELVEESRPLCPKDVDAVKRVVWARLSSAAALCLSGSFPPGVSAGFYAELVGAAREREIPTLVDAQGTPLRHALDAEPTLVKPNLEEALRTLGSSAGPDPERDGRSAVRGLTASGAEWALVSLGARGAVFGNGQGELWRVEAPAVEVLNPIGSGDALAGGLLYSLVVEHRTVPEAVVFGTACAAANCLTRQSSLLESSTVARLLPEVRLLRLD
jgi:1-phosphofructokinase family hexose kinase